MAEADDYESLPESTPLAVSAMAGAVAGVAEHCLMFPFDSVKTRMQSLMCERQHTSMRSVLLAMVREEGGILRPIRGLNAMAAGAGPAHAMYFTAIEKIRHALVDAHGMPEHLASGMAATAATVLHDAVMTPAEVVKQRMQMCCSPFRSCTDATLSILRSEGPKAFYRAYGTQLTMNIPFQTAVVTTYSLCQTTLNPSKEYRPWVHFCAGAVAGAVGSIVTMPLDVCKTLLNTQESAVLKLIHQEEVAGMLGAVRVVHRVSGMAGFFQGVVARVIYQAPATAVSWSIYELFKYLMRRTTLLDEVEQKYETLSDLRMLTQTSSQHAR